MVNVYFTELFEQWIKKVKTVTKIRDDKGYHIIQQLVFKMKAVLAVELHCQYCHGNNLQTGTTFYKTNTGTTFLCSQIKQLQENKLKSC